jgi:O-succinylbenzoate synthase
VVALASISLSDSPRLVELARLAKAITAQTTHSLVTLQLALVVAVRVQLALQADKPSSVLVVLVFHSLGQP